MIRGRRFLSRRPEPVPATGERVWWKADRETWVGDTATLFGVEELHYRDYVLRADEVTYHRSTSELEADGNVELDGGPDDIIVHAAHGDMHLNIHTARFFAVHGTMGVVAPLQIGAPLRHSVQPAYTQGQLADLRAKCEPYTNTKLEDLESKRVALPPHQCVQVLGWMRDSRVERL